MFSVWRFRSAQPCPAARKQGHSQKEGSLQERLLKVTKVRELYKICISLSQQTEYIAGCDIDTKENEHYDWKTSLESWYVKNIDNIVNI